MKACIAFVASMLPFTLAAEDRPVVGVVYNTKEMSSLTYECNSTGPERMECEFLQTAVRRKLQADEASAKREIALAEFDKAKKVDIDKTCNEMAKYSSLIESPNDSSESKAFLALAAWQKDETKKLVSTFATFCRSRSRADYAAMNELTIAKEIRTCTVSSGRFTQSFKLVGDTQPKQKSWVVDGNPSGVCGLVQLSRFEQVNEYRDFTNWVYHARKAVTNPKGVVLPGMKCSDLDQEEYFYDWKATDWKPECGYIEFGVL